MPHKRAKAVRKLLFFDNKTTPRSIDRFGFITFRPGCRVRFVALEGLCFFSRIEAERDKSRPYGADVLMSRQANISIEFNLKDY